MAHSYHPPPPTPHEEGADFTDAVMNTPLMKKMCALPTAKGTNPTTGVDTRDSLICPE